MQNPQSLLMFTEGLLPNARTLWIEKRQTPEALQSVSSQLLQSPFLENSSIRRAAFLKQLPTVRQKPDRVNALTQMH